MPENPQETAQSRPSTGVRAGAERARSAGTEKGSKSPGKFNQSVLRISNNRGGEYLGTPGFGRRLFRWIYLLLLFGYLLALVMTLFEIDAFQKLVAQLGASITDQGTAAGNTRQREILQAVRTVGLRSQAAVPSKRTDETEIPEGERQLYLQVAAKIDPLRMAITALDDIGNEASFQFRTDETYKRAQRDAFRELAGRTGRAVADLRQRIEELPACVPGTTEPLGCIEVGSKPLRTDLVTLQRAVAELRGYIDPDKQSESGSSDSSRGETYPSEEKLSTAAVVFVEELKNLMEDLKKAPTERSLGEEAEQTTEKTTEETTGGTAEGITQGTVARTAQETAEFKILKAIKKYQDTVDLVEEVDELLQRLEKGKADEVIDLQRASFKTKTAMAGDEARDEDSQGAEDAGKEFELTTFAASLDSDDGIRWMRDVLELYGINNNNPSDYQTSPPAGVEESVLDENLIRVVRQFQRDVGIADDGVPGNVTRGRLNAFINTCREDPECLKAKKEEELEKRQTLSIEDEILQLREALARLSELISPYIGNFKRIGDLSEQLADIEVAARRLEQLEVEIKNNSVASGTGEKSLEEARRTYQEQTLALLTAIEEMQNTLNQADSSIPIADAIGPEDPLANKKAVTILREFEALARYERALLPFSFLARPVPSCEKSDNAEYTDDEYTWASLMNWIAGIGFPPNGMATMTRQALNINCGFARASASLMNRIAGIGFHPRDMATMTRQALDIMLVIVMGAIGSLIFLIKYLLSQMLLRAEDGRAVLRPPSWYLFRPVFGIVVAFAIYLLYKTGQVALGGGSSNLLASDVNLPILGIVSLFAGLLSWQALEFVEGKGRKWLSAQRRENLWAAGLSGTLRRAGKTHNDCATQVGVTPNQVDRWIAGQDKVTPEMQDRITTWLNRDRDEIFGDTNPRDIDEGTLRWATGLKGVLEANRAGIDVPRLAQLIGQDVATVHGWVELKRQVDQEMQFLIADKLGESRDRLFTEERPDAEYWAVGLRAALRKGAAGLHTADDLARAIGSTPQNIRRYMELKASVPRPAQNLIVETLAVAYDSLFSPDLPPDGEFKWAAKLRECLRASPLKDAAELAEKIDTEAAWVRGWMEQEVCGEEDAPYCGQVAPETQRVLADAVGCAPGTLFRAERASADFKWVVMPRFRDLVDAPGRGGTPGLAGRLDLDVARIERWMSHREPVAPETQLALLRDLGLPVEELDSLFTRRPPVDPERPGDVWWATGLRAAVRRHPGYRTLGRLAAELEIPVETLFDQAEMLAPVPEDLRDRIKRLLAPASSGGNALFSTQAPDWDEFLWAPELRAALEQAEMGALELATALDVDLARVHDWMEMEKGEARTLWAKGKVKRGQICPATCDAIIMALGGRVERDQIFSVTRPDSGALWTVKPTFRIAVDAFEDRLVGFAEQVDTDPDRVERWADQVEPVGPDAQARVLEVFGMKPEDKGQLFSAKPRVEDAQG